MKCSAARDFMSQVGSRADPVAALPAPDLGYLSTNGYVLVSTRDDYARGEDEVSRLSQEVEKANAEREADEQARASLQRDEDKEHSISFRFEGAQEKRQFREKVAQEEAAVAKEKVELDEQEAKVNALIQERSTLDRMVPYGDGYVSLTGLGTLVLSDINVRAYRVADVELSDFLSEVKATYGELRYIADAATSYALGLKLMFPENEEGEWSSSDTDSGPHPAARTGSALWSVAIGLAKLRGEADIVGMRFSHAIESVRGLPSSLTSKLMAAEVVTAISNQDVSSLTATLKEMDKDLRNQGVPEEISAGVAATIMAGRRFDGSYPLDRFAFFRQMTQSFEAASILSVVSTPGVDWGVKFDSFRMKFSSWGYMRSEDTEIASAFLAIGELNADEVDQKLKYIVEQLHNYLEYPLVAGAILASIPVLEAHETLDLMEKAVTLLSGYAPGLEKSELVALAVRMIHGVRNEIVREVDSTAKISETPIQFTYPTQPRMFIWYHPVIIAHSYYHSSFSGMGGFHPAHSHGVGGFAG